MGIDMLAGNFLETLGLLFVELAAWCSTVSAQPWKTAFQKDGTKPL